MRTKTEVHVLGGHTNTVGALLTYPVDPQIVTSSYDNTVKLWDLVAGRAMTTMTQHKKAVRALASSDKELTFLSGAADNVKKWQVRDGKFLQNFSGHNAIINSLATNSDGVAVSGGDNGSMHLWDYDTGHCFQKETTKVQPGSLSVEAGILASTFDHSGSRLVTCEADKSIKIWRENSTATEETHPIDMDEWTKHCRALKRH
jgi:pleiotropic regulator 1